MSILSLLITPRAHPQALMQDLRQQLQADVALAADGRIAVALEVDPALDATVLTDALSADDAVARVELVAAWYDDDIPVAPRSERKGKATGKAQAKGQAHDH